MEEDNVLKKNKSIGTTHTTFTIKLIGDAEDLSDIVSDLRTEYLDRQSSQETTTEQEFESNSVPPKKKLKMTEEVLPQRVILVVPKDSPPRYPLKSKTAQKDSNSSINTRSTSKSTKSSQKQNLKVTNEPENNKSLENLSSQSSPHNLKSNKSINDINKNNFSIEKDENLSLLHQISIDENVAHEEVIKNDSWKLDSSNLNDDSDVSNLGCPQNIPNSTETSLKMNGADSTIKNKNQEKNPLRLTKSPIIKKSKNNGPSFTDKSLERVTKQLQLQRELIRKKLVAELSILESRSPTKELSEQADAANDPDSSSDDSPSSPVVNPSETRMNLRNRKQEAFLLNGLSPIQKLKTPIKVRKRSVKFSKTTKTPKTCKSKQLGSLLTNSKDAKNETSSAKVNSNYSTPLTRQGKRSPGERKSPRTNKKVKNEDESYSVSPNHDDQISIFQSLGLEKVKVEPVTPMESLPSLKSFTTMEPLEPLTPLEPLPSLERLEPLLPLEPLPPLEPLTSLEPLRSLEPLIPLEPLKSLEPLTPTKLQTSMESSTTTKTQTEVKLLTPTKLQTSMESTTTTKIQTEVKPLTPTKLQTSMEPSTTTKIQTEVKPLTPTKLQTSMELSTTTKTQTEVEPLSLRKPQTPVKPFSSTKPQIPMEPLLPTKQFMSGTSILRSKPITIVKTFPLKRGNHINMKTQRLRSILKNGNRNIKILKFSTSNQSELNMKPNLVPQKTSFNPAEVVKKSIHQSMNTPESKNPQITHLNSPIKMENDNSSCHNESLGNLFNTSEQLNSSIEKNQESSNKDGSSKSPQIKVNGLMLRAPDPNLLKNVALKEKIQEFCQSNKSFTKTSPSIVQNDENNDIKVEPLSPTLPEISESLVSTTTIESGQLDKKTKDCQLCDRLRLEVNGQWILITQLKQRLDFKSIDTSHSPKNNKYLVEDKDVSVMLMRQLEETNKKVTEELRKEKIYNSKLRLSLTNRDKYIKELEEKLQRVSKIFEETENNAIQLRKQLSLPEVTNLFYTQDDNISNLIIKDEVNNST